MKRSMGKKLGIPTRTSNPKPNKPWRVTRKAKEIRNYWSEN